MPVPRGRSEPSCSLRDLPTISSVVGINWDNRGTTPFRGIFRGAGLHYVEHRISMALLQISEPGQSPDPHQRRIAVGIDLGTTHSLVAAVRNGVAECLPDDEGRVLLPSVVRYLEQGGRQIGYDAVAAQSSDARNTIASAKRFMGRGLQDVAQAEELPYEFVQNPDNNAGGMVSVVTADGIKSPVEIMKALLRG